MLKNNLNATWEIGEKTFGEKYIKEKSTIDNIKIFIFVCIRQNSFCKYY